MKHAATVMIAAGIAGAAWFRPDQNFRAPVAKIPVPDPGPADFHADDMISGISTDWEPVDLHGPVPFPLDQVSELPSRAKTISDEQPFATTEDDELDASSGFDPKDRTTARPSAKSRSDATELEFDPIETEPSPPTVKSEWKSVEGRPLTIVRLGSGRFRTVILTGLDGRDRHAVRWADELTDALERRPDLLKQQEFVIIRAANPDGLADKVRENGRGVVLNRNFPTKRYQLAKDGTAGAAPASEPETRAILQTLYDLQPQRLLHLSSTTGNPGVFVTQRADEIAERLQRQSGLRASRLNLDLVPGSVEEFVDSTWTAEVVRLNLKNVSDEDVPEQVLPVVINAISAQEPTGKSAVAPVSTPRKEPSRWSNGPVSSPVPTDPNGSSSRRNRPVIHRGYEELPPPPQ